MFLLFGPPGAGKGTQAERLAQKYNLKKFSMGDRLREEVAGGTLVGKMIKENMRNGLLVPDNVVFEIVEDFILENMNSNIVFDGFPRNLNQAIEFDRILSCHNLKLNLAIELYISEEEIINRLSERYYCARCGAIYNKSMMPPDRYICERCGNSLIKREDDKESVIRNRLRVYNEETRPLIDYYKTIGIYHQVFATGYKDEVFNRIVQLINGYFK